MGLEYSCRVRKKLKLSWSKFERKAVRLLLEKRKWKERANSPTKSWRKKRKTSRRQAKFMLGLAAAKKRMIGDGGGATFKVAEPRSGFF